MTAFTSADILLAKLSDSEMSKWAVVACDQYTSEPQYREKTAEIAGDCPSALNLILPEVYLEAPDADSRIAEINKTMIRTVIMSASNTIPNHAERHIPMSEQSFHRCHKISGGCFGVRFSV